MHLESREASFKASLYAYLDVLQVWLKHPLCCRELRWVNDRVGDPLLDRPFVLQRGRRQRLRLTQPSKECLQFFAERDDAQANYGEFAFDTIAPTAPEFQRACRFGLIQPRPGLRIRTTFPNGNFRTADLGHPGIAFQAYGDRHSKITGEDCCHIEAKATGVRALRQIGIHCVADFLTFDHPKLWQDNLIILELDIERFGRFDANVSEGTCRRAPRKSDAIMGQVLFEATGATTIQEFAKVYAGERCNACIHDHSLRVVT